MYEALNTRRKATAEQGIKLIAGFDMMTKNPMAVQTKLLMDLLQENKDTEYGKRYGFGEIKSIEKHLAEVNPSYGDKVKNGLIQPVKILFSQPETYVLYKEMMLRMGNSIAQLKPVTVIGNEQQKNFFFTLVDDFEEIKALCAR